MKIVFLTPDRIVDRRIVLEGMSLQKKGHTVSVVADLGKTADCDNTYPEISIINAVCGDPLLKTPIKPFV